MLRRVTMEVMIPQLDDLQRVLGYAGAIDDRTGSTALGDDLYVLPFWTPEFCHAVIRSAEAVGGFDAQPGDPVPGRRFHW